MLLDRIDIDAHGPLHQVELGPFAEHLNVIFGPHGSGKTAIVRFIRDSLVGRQYPLGMLSSSTGRVVWADRNGLVHCRREKDGTNQGRRTVELESRGEELNRFGSLGHSWLAGISSSTDSRLATETLKLPESIVDGVITDTAIISVARVVSACVRSGLDSPDLYRSLPSADESIYNRRDGYTPCGEDTIASDDRRREHHRRVREKLAAIDADLARLSQLRFFHGTYGTDSESNLFGAQPQRHRRLLQLHDRARELRARQNEHRRWIAEIDHDLSRSGGHYLNRWRSSDHSIKAAISDERLRSRLDDLDAQMIHWRRALSEVRGLRQAILDGSPWCTPLPGYDEATLRRMRLDGFIDAIDRYDHSRSWDDFYPDRYRPLYAIDDIDYRIDSATRHIDWLLDRYAKTEHGHYSWYQARTAAMDQSAHADLRDALRAVRDELRHVQHYALNRHVSDRNESHHDNVFSNHPKFRHPEQYRVDASGSARTGAVSAGRELEELRRNEDWILDAMNQLNHHREQLLRDSSAALNAEIVSLARDNEYDLYILDRERRENVAQLGRINAELESCLQEAARVRRTMRSLPIVDSRWRDDRADWVHPLAADPSGGAVHPQDVRIHQERIALLQRQRAEIAKELESTLPHRAGVAPQTAFSPLSDAASRWLVRLSAGRLSRVEWPYHLFRGDPTSYHAEANVHTGVLINGRDEAQCAAADRALAVLAVRMAAGDLLGRCGRQVPIVLETHHELLSGLSADRHRSGPGFQAPLSRESGFDASPDFGANRSFDSAPYYYGCHPDFPNVYGTDLYGYVDREHRTVDAFVAALRDYARAGRQIVMLTSNSQLAGQMANVGARSFGIHHARILHPHRPLWKTHYQAESYVGPHAHVYGPYGADEVHPHDQPISSRCDVNRDFDVAWRETNGLYGGAPFNHRAGSDDTTTKNGHSPVSADRQSRSAGQTDWARDGARHRDGFYFAETYTTVDPGPAAATPAPDTKNVKSAVVRKPDSPFFLSVDSPIDQAPSIDAVAAARLRGLNVTHVNHLMQQDPNRLSDALGLANVDAASIRRWQAECRLVCRVPQLRGFDARVLVGCGISTPARLASIHPVDLLQDVEAFLATERGQKILLSGSSQELSRITSWIAAANATDGEIAAFGGNRHRNGEPDSRRGPRLRRPHDISGDRDFDSDRYEYEPASGVAPGRDRQLRRRRINRGNREADAVASAAGRTAGNGAAGARVRSDNRGQRLATGNGRGRAGEPGNGRGRPAGQGSERGARTDGRRSQNPRRRRSSQGNQDVVRYEREPRESREHARREYQPREYVERESRESSEHVEHDSRKDSRSEHELRFFLHREDEVVDAPSIGARMAARLNAIGIQTVQDLLTADPDTVASELDNKRVDADTVLQWQQQATLVCRVPMLRGHDAQLLVAAEVTTPEELSECDPSELFEIIDPISNSREGKRIIRGGKAPDLEEVTDWVRFGRQHRPLRAA